MPPRRARDSRADADRSFEQLYRGHRGDVYRAALRELGNVHDAEDVTQAAFVDAYRAVLGGTRPQAPRAWLLTIAENVRRRRFRTSLRRPREEPLDADAALAAEASHAQATALVDALSTLTAEQRAAFLLREITGLSYDEIAERTGSSVASVQMLLFRARKTLRDQLEPPQVHPAYLPLATLFSRFEGIGLAPRAAGAIGAATLAVGVTASVPPAQADSPPVSPTPHRATATVAAAPAVAPLRAARAPAVKERPEQRRDAKAAALPVARAAPVSRPAAVPAPAPAPQAPVQEPVLEQAPERVLATPPALPLASPAVSTPPIPLPPLLDAPFVDPVIEPLLGGAGAAGAAGAGAPPLPELPLDPLPPVP